MSDTSTPRRAPSPLDREISGSLLRLRRRAPFFATLALYARFLPTAELPTAATDGRDVFYNPEFLGALPEEHLDGVLLHEVLHAALGHVPRRSSRETERWNIAADIVVNGLLVRNGFELPDGALLDSDLQDFSVEEVFALLQRDQRDGRLPDGGADLLDAAPGDEQRGRGDAEGAGTGDGQRGQRGRRGRPQRRSDAERRELEDHWRRAIAESAAIGRTTAAGTLPLGVERAFQMADHPKLDWRTVLWRFLTPTPTDFATFDRRHLHRGLYLETLEAESLRVVVCVDTSGSIDAEMVGQLLAEVDGVLRAYPGVECWLYYADAAVYGPYRLEPGTPTPPPEGGGGTDFRPFFDAVGELTDDLGTDHAVGVYLTDGFGTFPDEAPAWPVLWAVTAGGLDDDHFPFGTVLRLGDQPAS